MAIDDKDNILHQLHAKHKLRQLFISRKDLLRSRIKPVESDNEEADYIERSILEANKFVPHAGPVNKQQAIPSIFSTTEVSLSWSAAPEIIFILVCIFDIIFSSYLMVVGMTGISWQSSIDAIVYETAELPKAAVLKNLSDRLKKLLRKYGDNYQMINLNIQVHGIVQLVSGIAHVINSIFGCKVILRGMKTALLIHCGVAFACLISEAFSGYIIFTRAKCEPELFEVSFASHFINKYTHGTDSKIKIDSVQRSLGCCGLSDWSDYLVPAEHRRIANASRIKDLAGDDVVLPSSCCNSWWGSNLQCASEVHLWPTATPKEKEIVGRRLLDKGCREEVKALCTRIVSMMGKGVLIASVGHAVLLVIMLICVIFQIKVINAMIEENIQKAQQAEDLCLGIFDADSDSSIDIHEFDFDEEDETEAFPAFPKLGPKKEVDPIIESPKKEPDPDNEPIMERQEEEAYPYLFEIKDSQDL